MTLRKTRSALLSLAAAALLAGVPSCSEEQPPARPGEKNERSRSGEAVNAAIAEAQGMAVFLLDTGARSGAPLAPEALARKAGWSIVPEDTLDHSFQGDAVILNGQLAVVLRKGAAGAEIYAVGGGTPKLRATLRPTPAGAETAALHALHIVENNPGAVELRALFRSPKGRELPLSLRLATGQVSVELVPGAAADVLVQCAARYVVVPDYFGDDLVYDAATFDASRVWLPAENFFLALLEGGDAAVMAVWESAGGDAWLLLGGRPRTVSGTTVRCVPKKKLWLGFLEARGFWSDAAPKDWTPPFDAQWRADTVGQDGTSTSRHLADGGAPLGSGWTFVYPIDRTRKTPLHVFCPVDVLRNTLGMGPCQYILSLEGGTSGEPPTPEAVTTWVEAKFERKQEETSKKQIARRLQEMLEHVRHVHERIRRYARYSNTVRALCRRSRLDVAKRIDGILAKLDRHRAARREAMGTPVEAARLVTGISRLIGKPDALAGVRKRGERLRAMGHAEDNVLSKCRMAARRVLQVCRMADVTNPEVARFVRPVVEQTENVLRGTGATTK